MKSSRNLRSTSIFAVMGVISAATAHAELLSHTPNVFELPTAAFDVGEPLSFADDLAAALRSGDLAEYAIDDIALTLAVVHKVDDAITATVGQTTQSVESMLALTLNEDGMYTAAITVDGIQSVHTIGEMDLTSARQFIEEATTAAKKDGVLASLKTMLLRGRDDHLVQGIAPGHVTSHKRTGVGSSLLARVGSYMTARLAAFGHLAATKSRRRSTFASA